MVTFNQARLPTRVLEFSIRETAERFLKVTLIYTAGRIIPIPQAVENRPRTPLPFQRFLVPDYEGLLRGLCCRCDGVSFA